MSDQPEMPQPAAEPQEPAPHHEPQAGPHAKLDKKAKKEIEQLRQQLEAAQSDLRQAKDQALRMLADTENLRKRLQREKDQYVKFAAESFLRELLPIVDSLSQALLAVDRQSDPQAVVKGVHMIYRQLLGVMEKEGVQRIATVGEAFDPHRHEAVGFVEVDGQHPDNTIAEEVHAGYTVHGKLLRPALVKVARQPSAPAPAASDGTATKISTQPEATGSAPDDSAQ